MECVNNWFVFLVCARWPWFVLIGGLSVAIALAVGVIYLKVTIDPVELWASPTSQTRKDKDYFDENFNPFYRTTQVIIHATSDETVSRRSLSIYCFNKYLIFKMLLFSSNTNHQFTEILPSDLYLNTNSFWKSCAWKNKSKP